MRDLCHWVLLPSEGWEKVSDRADEGLRQAITLVAAARMALISAA